MSAAVDYLDQRKALYLLEDGKTTIEFVSWNAESVYFEDPEGNIGEFIVRHDLENKSEEPFSIRSIINLNEVGIPNRNIPGTDIFLSQVIGTSFYKGNKERFGTHGGPEANFLMPNTDLKPNWFPTNCPVEYAPFDLKLSHQNKYYTLTFPPLAISSDEEDDLELG